MSGKPSKSKTKPVLVSLALMALAALALPVAAAAKRPPIFLGYYEATGAHRGGSVLELTPNGTVRTIGRIPAITQVARAIATTRNGDVLVADIHGVLRFDRDTGERTRIASGPNVQAITDLQQGRNGIVYGSAYRCVFNGHGCTEASGIVRINLATHRTRFVAEFNPLGLPSGIALGPRDRVYIKRGHLRRAGSPPNHGGVLQVDLDTSAVRRIAVSRALAGGSGLEFADRHLYTTCCSHRSGVAKMMRINPRTGSHTLTAWGLVAFSDISIAPNGDFYLAGVHEVERIKHGDRRPQTIYQDPQGSPDNAITGIAVGK